MNRLIVSALDSRLIINIIGSLLSVWGRGKLTLIKIKCDFSTCNACLQISIIVMFLVCFVDSTVFEPSCHEGIMAADICWGR